MELTIPVPDDWHIHLRDGAALATTVPHVAARFARAIVMPNLKPPVTSAEQALAYRSRILAACPAGAVFEPLMTLYLTDHLAPDEITRARASGVVQAVKFYPAGATTNSDAGVTRLDKVYPALARMEELGMPLLVHGEVTDPTVDVFDREQVFLERELAPLLKRFTRLKVVIEHITTSDAVAFVRNASAQVAATITAHHLLFDRNAMFNGGLRPHFYCLPVLKRNIHREALINAATGGESKFFLGTDSAPHARPTKETSCGCAGIYSAHAGIELYAEVFEQAGALDKLAGFASRHGPAFYGLPVNRGMLILRKESWMVPAHYAYDGSELVPLRAGEAVQWRMLNRTDL